MNIFFRCDASIEIGTGHVMRCLTLADALTEQGHQCIFISKSHKGHLTGKLIAKGYQVYGLECDENYSSRFDTLAHSKWLGSSQVDDAVSCQKIIEELECDWLIIDHYAIDSTWESLLRSYTKKIMVIDDLADRVHDCDVLLDQNLGRDKADYQELVPEPCQLLIGTEYALLRPEFAQWRKYSLNRRQSEPQLETILINLGGVDKDNITMQILKALVNSALPINCTIQVIMGATAPHIESVRSVANELPWHTEVIVNADNMAELMANADLAIGASGSTTWERCCLGLPSILLCVAENQKQVISYLKKYKKAFMFDYQKMSLQIPEVIEIIMQNKDSLLFVSQQCAQLVDGLGTKRIRGNLLRSL